MVEAKETLPELSSPRGHKRFLQLSPLKRPEFIKTLGDKRASMFGSKGANALLEKPETNETND